MSCAINRIGVVNENSLHAALKELYRAPGSRCEVKIGNYIVDIVRDDLLIEIQTSNFGSIRHKLAKLLENKRLRLVYPLASEKIIIVYDKEGEYVRYQRKSPKKNTFYDIVRQLIYIPNLLIHPHFELEVLLIREEELRLQDGKGSWRRKGVSIADRILLEIVDRRTFAGPGDYLALLPQTLPPMFTNRELALQLKLPLRTARMLTYCLKKMELLHVSRKEGNTQTFTLKEVPQSED